MPDILIIILSVVGGVIVIGICMPFVDEIKAWYSSEANKSDNEDRAVEAYLDIQPGQWERWAKRDGIGVVGTLIGFGIIACGVLYFIAGIHIFNTFGDFLIATALLLCGGLAVWFITTKQNTNKRALDEQKLVNEKVAEIEGFVEKITGGNTENACKLALKEGIHRSGRTDVPETIIHQIHDWLFPVAQHRIASVKLDDVREVTARAKRYPHFDRASNAHITYLKSLSSARSSAEAHLEGIERWFDHAANVIAIVAKAIPPQHHGARRNTSISLSSPLYDLISDDLRFLHKLLYAVRLWDGITDRNLEVLQEIDRNRDHWGTQKLRPLFDQDDPKITRMSREELYETFIEDHPVQGLLNIPVAVDVPETTRHSHHWIIGGSGHGKSQCLQTLIAHDLERVAEGEMSLIVMESQNNLINNIARLKMFAPGEPLYDRLVWIDAADAVEWPICLNLFDVNIDRINQYSLVDREKLTNGVIELYDFVLGSLLAAGMTQKQSVIFRYITRLMLHMPGATIHTFKRLLVPGASTSEEFRPHVEKLTGTAREFFETEFEEKQYKDTKEQVTRRLWGVLENQTFERMFSHPKSKLDLFTEMNEGKVILINTAKDVLKEDGCNIFGRFMIAMIAQAAEERAAVADPMSTIFYIDEAQDVFDNQLPQILSQVRKRKVGLVMAHQYIDQASSQLLSSLTANTAIKFVGGVSPKDARTLAPALRTTPEFIDQQPNLTFAAYINDTSPTAIPLRFRYGLMEGMETMSDQEQQQVRTRMREKYAVHHSGIRDAGVPQEQPDVDDVDVGLGSTKPNGGDAHVASPADDW